MLNLPEVNAERSDLPQAWVHTPVAVGSLELLDPHDFQRDPTRVRWCDPRDQWLFGLYDAEPDPGGERYRSRLAPDTYLLICDDVLAGWAIARPARFLAPEGARQVQQNVDERLGTLLARFLNLLTESAVDRLEAAIAHCGRSLSSPAMRWQAFAKLANLGRSLSGKRCTKSLRTSQAESSSVWCSTFR
ncbi:hypothetical protein [Actinospica robiniae]|uniref:hypothetical protein n=1 Tax=Actinospica robiniae TaxID=304901 RepID=UPI0003FD86E8|nr:hypothetical protein [Actinospica robiniae]